MFQNCLKQLRRRLQASRPRARRHSRVSCSVERCEVRLLPSGNVVATVVDGNLVLNGDAKDNSLKVDISGGNVVVTGLDGTTINGIADFTAVTGSSTITGNLVAKLGAGDDKLAIGDNVVIQKDVQVTDFLGATTLGMRSVEINGNLLVQTGHAADSISLKDTTIDGDARIATHAGADLVSLDGSTVTGAIVIDTGAGKDGVVIDDSTLSSSAKLRTGGGADAALVRATTIAGDVTARTGPGADFLMVQTTTVDGTSKVQMGKGADSFVTQGTNEFKKSAVVRGGLGRKDAIDISAGTTFDSTKLVRGFHKTSVDASLIDDVLNNATTGLLTRTTALEAAIDALLA